MGPGLWLPLTRQQPVWRRLSAWTRWQAWPPGPAGGGWRLRQGWRCGGTLLPEGSSLGGLFTYCLQCSAMACRLRGACSSAAGAEGRAVGASQHLHVPCATAAQARNELPPQTGPCWPTAAPPLTVAHGISSAATHQAHEAAQACTAAACGKGEDGGVNAGGQLRRQMYADRCTHNRAHLAAQLIGTAAAESNPTACGAACVMVSLLPPLPPQWVPLTALGLGGVSVLDIRGVCTEATQ